MTTVASITSFFKSNAFTRAYRTALQVAAAFVALTGSGYLPANPGKDGTVVGLAGLASLLHNGLVDLYKARKSKQLYALSVAIGDAAQKAVTQYQLDHAAAQVPGPGNAQ
jgi:hypothetical protein